ncbi:Maf family nucleotide pyrophosphatase [Limibacter armeniacum]|uniref:Maf family nucleotide pyrophosphatase n=1 Tax=Limibacter armeniacum TaxID=466084 RepID=UPI002FE69AF1
MFPLRKRLVLASKSPRRQQLLQEMGFEFEVRTKDVEEIFPSSIPVDQVATYLAALKADAFAGTLGDDELLITSDTVVVNNGQVLGKPADRDEAYEMIEAMSGKEHEVYTGVCLMGNEKKVTFSDVTKVRFHQLTASEIDYYIDQYKPFDKAGAYGIQEWIGLIGISAIEGTYFNVMGLPTDKLYQQLKTF